MDADLDADPLDKPWPSSLSAAETKRAAAFRGQADRARYVAAHVALRAVLGDRLGCPPALIEFSQLPCPLCGAPHGRPVVVAPRAPQLHFSLSHGGSLVMIGVASTPVGVDVEPYGDLAVADDLARALHSDETAELTAVDVPRRPRALAELWVRKEAYLKGLGTGLGRSLSADYLGAAAPQRWPQGWWIDNVATKAGHAAAYAVQDDHNYPNCRQN